MISYAAYVMAKQADDSVPDDPLEWFDQFGMFDLTIAMPQILELWGMNTNTLAKPKKKVRGTDRELTTALFLLRACELGISIADLDLLDVGMVYDMLTESNNDHAEYAVKANQDDFDRF